ncbi:LysR family transcriptional regulator [Paenibacillus polymyxa]|uniref:LysR family transcriptional regulator n=1 Tax=Paenibacillus TaxID=44249 RepID=UPI0008FB9C1F|nr:LysR family transcriptional regulator [Paenibacillus polymyxa]APB76712.1 transcriptional regulator CynR [Paenibacillus polymyxa]POR29886.1 hypothetical protein CG775_01995 [Paenibacillus polymyxa]
MIVNELLGSVTRASELLNISQPAITAQIKKFEKEISLTLLMPLGRGIALTDAGKKLAVLAKRLFAVEQQIEQLSQDYRDGVHGHIRLAATYLPAHFLIPAWIAKFKQEYEYVERGELCRVYVEDIQLLNSIAICTRKNEPLSTATLNLIQLIRNHS